MCRFAIILATSWVGPLGSGPGMAPPAFPDRVEYAQEEREYELAFDADRPQPGPASGGAWTCNCGGGREAGDPESVELGVWKPNGCAAAGGNGAEVGTRPGTGASSGMRSRR